MEVIFKRDPRFEIAKKVGFGILASFFILVINILLNQKEFSFSELGLVLFLIGGLFLVVGGLRDFLESIVIRKVRGQDINEYLSSPQRDYFYGFGKAGEDIVAGAFLILFSFLTVLF
ncbi:MAG: hypothetical protein EAX86_04385 [Candidatus Heimdallarchaeota archaeon]|nr:hypothetical protein [Candidatus Heimdallarchaeota archaeon]